MSGFKVHRSRDTIYVHDSMGRYITCVEDDQSDQLVLESIEADKVALQFREAERIMKANNERQAGVDAILNLGAPGGHPLPSQRAMAYRLYDAGVTVTSPVSLAINFSDMESVKKHFPVGAMVEVDKSAQYNPGCRSAVAGKIVRVARYSINGYTDKPCLMTANDIGVDPQYAKVIDE